jgi:hypothetical protein
MVINISALALKQKWKQLHWQSLKAEKTISILQDLLPQPQDKCLPLLKYFGEIIRRF